MNVMFDVDELGEVMPSPSTADVLEVSEETSYAYEPLELHMTKALSELYAVHSGEELTPLKAGEHYVTLVYAHGMKRTVVHM